MRMIRKQVRLSVEQDEWVQRRARELGVTQSEIIRQIIGRLDVSRRPARYGLELPA